MANPYLEGVDSASTTPANPYLEGVESTSNPYLAGVEATTSTPETNWAGTGKEMSAKEYFGSGFAGRFMSNAVRGDSELMAQADANAQQQLGPNYKSDPLKYQQVFTTEYRKLVTERDNLVKQERAKNPEPTFSKSMQEFGKELITNPWKTAKSMVYELGKDPELLLLGPLIGSAAETAKATDAAVAVGKTAKVASAIKNVGKSAAVGAGTGAGLETMAQAGEPGGPDLQKIVNTAGTFAVLGATMHAGLSAAKSAYGKVSPKVDTKAEFDNLNNNLNDLETELNSVAPEQMPLDLGDTGAAGPIPKSRYTPSADTVPEQKPEMDLNKQLELQLENNPELKVAGDAFKSFENESPVDAVMKTMREIAVNNRLATLWRRGIEKLIPDSSIRERTTMALEGERPYDKLLTDEEKRQTLFGDKEEVRAEKENLGIKPNIGLTGVLDLYKGVIEHLTLGDSKRITQLGFNTFWDNYIKRNNLVDSTAEEKLTHITEKANKLQYAVNKLLSLPSEEHAIPVMKEIQTKLEEIGKIAQKQGLMDHLRHNYISHVLNFSESALSDGQRRTLVDALFGDKKSRFNRDFTQHRVYNTIRELETALYDTGKQLGLDTRGVKVERDVAKIAEIYQKSMMNANLIKRLLNHLENTTTKNLMGEDIPLITRDPNIAFRNKYQFFQGKGSQGLEGYAIHPDIVDTMKFVANQTDPSVLLKAAGGISMLAKYLNTMGSLFHATSLFVARTTSSPGTMIKEIFTRGKGTKLALEELEHNGASESVKLAQRSGLQIELPEDAARTILTDISNTTDKMVGKVVGKENVKVLGKVVDPLEELFLKKLNRFTWDYMHAAGKLHLFQTWFTKIKMKNPNIPDEVIAKEVASYVNNTLGGLDWLKVANESSNAFIKSMAMKALNPRGRQWMQIILFAPDWTLSTIRSFTKALPKELLKPQNWELREGIKGFINPKVEGDLARRYVVNTAIMWATILNGFNYAFSGHPIWENKDPTRIDLGDGTTMQMAKHSMESAEWILHPLKTGANKLAVLPKTAFTTYLASQGMAKDVKTPFGKIEGNSPQGVFANAAQSVIPFQVNELIKAPPGEGTKRALASFLGIPIYGQTNKMNTSIDVLMERKAQRKESRRENKIKKMEDR